MFDQDCSWSRPGKAALARIPRYARVSQHSLETKDKNTWLVHATQLFRRQHTRPIRWSKWTTDCSEKDGFVELGGIFAPEDDFKRVTGKGQKITFPHPRRIFQLLLHLIMIEVCYLELCYRVRQFRDVSNDWENYISVIGWEQANLSSIINLRCSAN